MLRNIKSLNKINVRSKSFNSKEWLKRRDADIYVERARRENYRCRSVYKLMEINEKYKLVKPGLKVLDIGAAPGSWSQYLSDKTNSIGKDLDNPKGVVIAIDLKSLFPLEGVTVLSNKDFTKQSTQNEILEILKGEKLDFIFSDMAPSSTGVKTLDQENIVRLVYPVVVFSVKTLKIGGGCLIKIWEGQHLKLVEDMKKFFNNFKLVKPKATYSTSSESYLLGREFVGLKT